MSIIAQNLFTDKFTTNFMYTVIISTTPRVFIITQLHYLIIKLVNLKSTIST